MLSLYPKLFGLIPVQSKPKNPPSQITSEPTETELNTEKTEHLKQTKLTEEMRQVKERYHIDRRFL